MPNETSVVSSSIQNACEEFLKDVIQGLSSDPKSIPSKYLYDARGSRLFDEICEQPEYYPTRTELSIMRDRIEEIATAIGPEATLIEFGSGSGIKTQMILEHCSIAEYVPIEISRDHLEETAERLQAAFPHTRMVPLCADFSQDDLPLEDLIDGDRRVVYFPGSTIGNFEASEADALVASMSELSGTDGGVLVGIDLRKDIETLEAAYNDANRVTDAFTLNLLVRMNHELDTAIDIDAFRHVAFYDKPHERIEIYLESLQGQTLRIGDREFELSKGERIRTEYSHKYDVDEFARSAARHGLRLSQVWSDAQDWFALAFFEKAKSN